ncbi:hypothetical protein F383_29776 [Gossypium arboreum]|uniref:Uncharacterized protein n=1 Tax=Gossypium arboreum TaxID=29729 RepID=A0A0B0PF98_GOSAR|nr:hypothetical protein F383_29776 [Gossypium arboreum]
MLVYSATGRTYRTSILIT